MGPDVDHFDGRVFFRDATLVAGCGSARGLVPENLNASRRQVGSGGRPPCSERHVAPSCPVGPIRSHAIAISSAPSPPSIRTPRRRSSIARRTIRPGATLAAELQDVARRLRAAMLVHHATPPDDPEAARAFLKPGEADLLDRLVRRLGVARDGEARETEPPAPPPDARLAEKAMIIAQDLMRIAERQDTTGEAEDGG